MAGEDGPIVEAGAHATSPPWIKIVPALGVEPENKDRLPLF